MNVLFIHGANCGVSYYRSWMVEKWLKRLPGVETMRFPNEKPRVYWTEDKLPPDSLYPSMERLGAWADIIHCGRMEALSDVSHFDAMRDWYRQKGKKSYLVSDVDDDLLHISRDNPVYTQWNVDISDTIQLNNEPLMDGCPPVPITMKDGSTKYINNVRADYQYFAMRQLVVSDAVTVSTPYLRRLYGPYNQKLFVLKNAVDVEDMKPMPKRNDGTVRIGWAGGHAHYDDLQLVWDVLVALCEKYPQVRFVYCGTKMDFLQKLSEKQMEFHSFVDIAEWPEKLRQMQFDIGIAPLTGKPFNRGKSNIKFLENATQKTPTVCSAVDPFLESVINGKTGMIAMSQSEWYRTLSALIESESERKRIGQNAYNEVRRLWTAEKMANHWRNAFEKVLQ